MAPRKCCMPYCRTEDIDNKQFFKLDSKDFGKIKEIVGHLNISSYCCQNHYDLANDTKNFIKYKYIPGRNLLLRPGVLPHKKIPANVCRVCLKLVFRGDDFVYVSEQKSAEKADIIKTCLPDLDLTLTFDPVVCQKCFKPLKSFYEIKRGCLKTEVTVVKCVKDIAKKHPNMLIKSCSINLFDNYATLRDIKADIEFKDGIQILNIDQNAEVQNSNKLENETFSDQKADRANVLSIADESGTFADENTVQNVEIIQDPGSGIYQIYMNDEDTSI